MLVSNLQGCKAVPDGFQCCVRASFIHWLDLNAVQTQSIAPFVSWYDHRLVASVLANLIAQV